VILPGDTSGTKFVVFGAVRLEETMEINTRNPVSSANIGDHPIHPTLTTLPIGFWIATLLADIGFWWTPIDGWATAALWLLGAAILTTALAAVAGLIDFMGDERISGISEAWQHAIGNELAVLISLFSFYWRYSHGAAGVLPIGMISSFIVVGIILFTRWKGGEMVFRHRVAVQDEPK
jgi:uncharacterized membrane protein